MTARQHGRGDGPRRPRRRPLGGRDPRGPRGSQPAHLPPSPARRVPAPRPRHRRYLPTYLPTATLLQFRAPACLPAFLRSAVGGSWRSCGRDSDQAGVHGEPRRRGRRDGPALRQVREATPTGVLQLHPGGGAPRQQWWYGRLCLCRSSSSSFGFRITIY